MFFQVANGTKDLLTLQHGIDWHRHFSPCHTVSPQQKNAMFLVSLLCSWKSCIAISHCPRGSTCFLLILPSSERVALLWVPKTSGESCKFHRFFGIPASLWLLSGQFVHPWLGTPPNLDISTLKSKQALQVTWRHNPAHPAKIDVQHVKLEMSGAFLPHPDKYASRSVIPTQILIAFLLCRCSRVPELPPYRGLTTPQQNNKL